MSSTNFCWPTRSRRSERFWTPVVIDVSCPVKKLPIASFRSDLGEDQRKFLSKRNENKCVFSQMWRMYSSVVSPFSRTNTRTLDTLPNSTLQDPLVVYDYAISCVALILFGEERQTIYDRLTLNLPTLCVHLYIQNDLFDLNFFFFFGIWKIFNFYWLDILSSLFENYSTKKSNDWR